MTIAKRAMPRAGFAPAPRSLHGFVPGPKAVGSFVPKLAKKSFEKFGFATAAILTDWSSIVGQELAAVTVPERLRWPRPPEGAGAEPASKGTERGPASPAVRQVAQPRSGATLMLQVDSSRALDVQYKTAQIVERINAYFGYMAVTDIRLSQGPVMAQLASARTPARPNVSPKTVLKGALGRGETNTITAGAFEDADLRQALERLGAAVSAAPHRHG